MKITRSQAILRHREHDGPCETSLVRPWEVISRQTLIDLSIIFSLPLNSDTLRATTSETDPKSDKTECGNYRGISLVSHAGKKVLLKVVARRLSAYCDAKGLLPREQCGFRPNPSIADMIFVVCRLQEIGRKAKVSLFMCFIDLQKAYDTVDRTLLWQVLTRVGASPEMIPGSSHQTFP